jgi:hypothetical protein
MRMTPAARLLAAVAVVAAQAFLAAPARADVYAVVVGYNGGRDGLPTLRFADDDAARFSMLLTGLAGGADQVRLLTTLDAETTSGLSRAGLHVTTVGPPTRTALRSAFDDVARALAARPQGATPPIFYFVYAGHGLRGRILLAPEAGAEAALTGRELRAAVAELTRAAPTLRAYVFLDACRSQSLFTERGEGDPGPGPDLSAEIDALEGRADEARIGVLTAAFSGRPAGEVSALGAGYFSHVLSSGLAGAADADGDRVVSFGELAAFVAYNTERLGAQRPWFSPPGGDLSAPTVDLRGPRTLLELSAAPSGRYVVEASGGRPILAEAVKGDRRPLRLALPAGRYRVVRTVGGAAAHATEVELVANASADLMDARWPEAPAVAALARGDEDPPAFTSAFTPEAVATLSSAYASGREAAGAPRAFANALGLATTFARAPLDLPELEVGVAARYRRRLPRAFVGARVSFGRSSHVADEPFHLERTGVFLEGGPRWSWADRFDLFVVVSAGGGPLLRRGADGALSGDLFAMAASVGLGGELRLDRHWSLAVDVRSELAWVDVDGARRRDANVAAQVGVAWGF